MPDPEPPLCVICLVLRGPPAAPAITLIGGDAICADHVRLRADCASLPGAIHVARTGLETPRLRRSPQPVSALTLPVHEVRQSLLADPLTAREQMILRYLTSTLSGDEIAAELFVTINTVKTHLRGLYRKLGVTGGRRPAVARARQLGLL